MKLINEVKPTLDTKIRVEMTIGEIVVLTSLMGKSTDKYFKEAVGEDYHLGSTMKKLIFEKINEDDFMGKLYISMSNIVEKIGEGI